MPKNEAAEMLEQLYQIARLQFGPVIKSRWLYDGDGCPGCGREIDAIKIKKKRAMSLNAFIFRDHGVLIAYLLCGECATFIMESSKTSPNVPTSLHAEIEKNLKAGYLKKQGH